MNERQKRLKEVYDHMRTYFGIHTQGQFADAIGYSRPVISSALNGDKDKLTDKLFKSIDEKFPGIFNLDYLLNGKGTIKRALPWVITRARLRSISRRAISVSRA